MKTAPITINESARLKALHRYHILDTGFEKEFDDLVKLASYICEAPISLISLVAENKQWFKAKVGLEMQETPRSQAFCAHAIHTPNLFVIEDATKDERFWDNPLVTNSPDIRFYAGMPLTTPEGFRLGTLCVIDQKPRQLSLAQKQALQTLATQVITQLELRLKLKTVAAERQELVLKNEEVQQKNSLLEIKQNKINEQNKALKQATANIEQHNRLLKAKQVEITTQNTELKQSQQALLAQRDEIALAHKKLWRYNERIIANLRYAKRVQQVILPTSQEIQQVCQDYFVLYRPKDIVSGDFYWVEEVDNQVFMVVADCTGHGVPGAFMSLVGATLLDRIVKVKREYHPAKILEALNTEVRRVLHQEVSDDRSGMDIAICKFEKISPEQNLLTFAGAKHSVYYTHPHEQNIRTLKGTPKAIGGVQRTNISFTNQCVRLPVGSTFYLCSDGYVDQNDAQRNKIGQLLFLQLLQHVQSLTLANQQQFLLNFLEKHMQHTEQRDDILLMGFRM
ncbi:GAF domain-containing SpoIIE family protein phosphatase [Microscilla marina]|uniref:Serine/threonine protein kinases n=1 Tax=Microscilla marina ATCC 23134 TaxID=313606 RepID=A1ZNR6_MICM2|nr:SpoIIE family protein phosphatase [Microscilla marina]EAY27955.1 serine/threonine protein kinases [Microscilla marina ATCC 23134]